MLSAIAVWAGCGISGNGDVPASLFTGTVSTNAPLVGGTLTVTDSSTPAKNFTAPVGKDGSYSIDVSAGMAPFLFRAQGRSAARDVDLYSASAAHSGKVDISPLSTLVVSNAAGHDCTTSPCAPSIFTAARLTDADMKVQGQLAALLTQYGLAIADALDSRKRGTAKNRKLVYFKYIAVGGYAFSRVPLEFVRDTATGNWRMSGNQRASAGVKARKELNTFIPIPGASSLGQWLAFSKESSTYPYGATLITVRGSDASPPVTLEYLEGENGATRVAGAAIVETIAGVSFLPACPRRPRQPGSCVEIEQLENGQYAASFSSPPTGSGEQTVGAGTSQRARKAKIAGLAKTKSGSSTHSDVGDSVN